MASVSKSSGTSMFGRLRINFGAQVGEDERHRRIPAPQRPNVVEVHVRNRGRVRAVAFEDQDVATLGQLVQARTGFCVARVADHPTFPVEQEAETGEMGNVLDLDGPEAEGTRLLPGPVDLHEAKVQLVGGRRDVGNAGEYEHVGQKRLDPRRPDHE